MNNYQLLHNLHERNIRITNAYLYDLANTLVASGYPMLTKVIPRDANESDVKRAVKLANTPAGSGHNNFLCGIRVSFDLTVPRYIWQEAQRYHWFDIVSSQSTMHKITQMELSSQEFTKDILPSCIQNLRDCVETYGNDRSESTFRYLKSSIPEGLLLTARISTNYQQLRTMYHQRKSHRLQEWQQFCEWIQELPYGKELITGETLCSKSNI